MNIADSKFKESLRIIWAVAAKDVADAIKNRAIASVILGVTFLILSAQALPLLLKLDTTPRVIIYDAGDSRLVAELSSTDRLNVQEVPSRQEMEVALGEGSEAVLGLVIPSDFDQTLESGSPANLDGYFVHWVSRSEADEVEAAVEQQIAELAGQPVHISTEGNVVYPRPDSDGRPYMIALSLVATIISIGMVMVPYLILEEKETRTIDALMVSPASVNQVVIGKALAGSVYCLASGGVVLLLNLSMITHWGLMILTVFCGALLAVSLGLLMGSLFDNMQNMSLWLVLPMIVLLIPLFLINTMSQSWPAILRAALPWVPSVSLSKVIRISMSNNVPVPEVLLNLGGVVGSAVLLLAVVAWILSRSDR